MMIDGISTSDQTTNININMNININNNSRLLSFKLKESIYAY